MSGLFQFATITAVTHPIFRYSMLSNLRVSYSKDGQESFMKNMKGMLEYNGIGSLYKGLPLAITHQFVEDKVKEKIESEICQLADKYTRIDIRLNRNQLMISWMSSTLSIIITQPLHVLSILAITDLSNYCSDFEARPLIDFKSYNFFNLWNGTLSHILANSVRYIGTFSTNRWYQLFASYIIYTISQDYYRIEHWEAIQNSTSILAHPSHFQIPESIHWRMLRRMFNFLGIKNYLQSPDLSSRAVMFIR
ncbi:hypothetical protein SNEBB_010196 [Seison nebaliae]|nr:hypothetical protein SNEBB_010196 [Seison nebaliae]